MSDSGSTGSRSSQSSTQSFGRAVNTTFPSEVTNNFGKYFCEDDCVGFTYILSSIIVTFNPSWKESYKRYKQFLYRSRVWMYRVSLIHDGKLYFCYGAGFTEPKASNAASYFLMTGLMKNFPGFIMPRHVIGYPNWRGHCFAISALLPLFHCYPFLRMVFMEDINFERRRHLAGGHLPDYRDSSGILEVPFFWTNSIFQIYRRYHYYSFSGVLPLFNGALMCYQLLDPSKKQKCVKPDKQRPVIDLQLDESLTKGFISCFKNFCDEDLYSSPGGDERKTVQYLLTNLGSEIPKFTHYSSFHVTFEYVCRSCSGKTFTNSCYIPVLHVDYEEDFRSLFISPLYFVYKQIDKLQVHHAVNSGFCYGPIRSIISATIDNFPQYFLIGVGGELRNIHSTNIPSIPDVLIHKLKDQEFKYKRLASTVCFNSYRSARGNYFGDIYIVPKSTDKIVGAHTYVHLATKKGFYEINNGKIFPPDRQIFNIPTPTSLHLYQLEKHFVFLPDILDECILERPVIDRSPMDLSPLSIRSSTTSTTSSSTDTSLDIDNI